MMVEVERDWEDRLVRARENVREHADWRINAIQQAYQARNKRRHASDEDEEEATAESVSKLETQLAERTKEVEHLKAEAGEADQVMGAVKETLRMHKEAAERLQDQTADLQFQLADQQKLAADLGTVGARFFC